MQMQFYSILPNFLFRYFSLLLLLLSISSYSSSGTMDSKGENEKLKNYEAQYASYLKAKYFSDKDIYGGQIFEEKVNVDGMTIRASSEEGTKSYADPLAYWNEKFGRSEPLTETTANLSNGKQSSKKS